MPSRKSTLPGRLLRRSFFEGSPERVAPLLLGKLLVRKVGERKLLAGRIVEVEAYLGPHHKTPDPAAHSHRGPTPRNEVLFGPAGQAYVYFIYGRYSCVNVSCEKSGQGGGILFRALDPIAGIEQITLNRGLIPGSPTSALTSGPGRLCQALDITREKFNGVDLLDPASPLQLRDDGFRVSKILVTPRIGIRHAAELPLRFALPGHPCVSGAKSLTGKCIFTRAKTVTKK